MMGEETFHPDTRALLTYGRALAGSGAAPRKGGADQVLERIFVIERASEGRLPIRTFGSELIPFFGRDMRDYDFARFFLEADAPLLHAFIGACLAAQEPGIARVSAQTISGKILGAEILLTPLKVDAALLGTRLLGMFQPLGGESFLGNEPIHLIRIGSLHPPAAKLAQRMRLVVVND